MSELFFLLIGWSLGLFSPLITERIQERRRKPELKRSLLVELYGVRYTAAQVAYLSISGTGGADRALINWIMPIVSDYNGPLALPTLPEDLKKLAQLSDHEIQQVGRNAEEKFQGLKYKKFSLPFLDAQLGSLSMFSPEFQQHILEIRARVDILNEEMDRAQFYHDKSFDLGGSPANLAAVLKNYKESCKHIGIISQQLVDMISHLLKIKG